MPAATALPEDTGLSGKLARQIAAEGPLSVMEYMRQCNAAYYAKSDPLGRDGDFITAPEISQMFGELVGLWLADLWLRQNCPDNLNYVELGPGRGTLAADSLRAMDKIGLNPSVHFVEASPALRQKQEGAVAGAAYHDAIDSLPEDGPLLIVANEFFDALPVRQFVASDDGWREQFVDCGQGEDGSHIFRPVTGGQDYSHLVPEDMREAEPGSIWESNPETTDTIGEVSARLVAQGGAMLICDYGYTQPALGSTLQAVSAHKYADPFERPGEVDLTAHVDFVEIANISSQCGVRASGPVDQGFWLSALGINQRTEALVRSAPDRAQEIIAARNRLVQPEEMGKLFKMLALTAPDWPLPEGFTTSV